MRIIVVGNESNLLECRQKFGDKNEYIVESDCNTLHKVLKGGDVVFNFLIRENSLGTGMDYSPENIIFLNAAETSLFRLAQHYHKISGNLFGFAGLPTFLNREILEVSLHKKEHLEKLKGVCNQLNTAFEVVEDRVGLVTPRVICMIINEAYYTVEEGTASREDIDLAMKLGTNYPWGPFEWSKRIGIRHVYGLLDAVYQDTADERYKICPLLKQEYLQL